MIPRTIIHLLSGGLDSVTLLYDLQSKGEKVHCLLVDYKQRHAQELTFASLHCRRLGLLWTKMEIPPLGGLTEENPVIPNRNAILLSLAVNLAVKAGADTVTIGCNAGDAALFPDCRPEFIAAMNSAVAAAGYRVEICAPYITKTKPWIAGMARELGVPIPETWSCYRGGAQPCGVCVACKTRQEALA